MAVAISLMAYGGEEGPSSVTTSWTEYLYYLNVNVPAGVLPILAIIERGDFVGPIIYPTSPMNWSTYFGAMSNGNDRHMGIFLPNPPISSVDRMIGNLDIYYQGYTEYYVGFELFFATGASGNMALTSWGGDTGSYYYVWGLDALTKPGNAYIGVTHPATYTGVYGLQSNWVEIVNSGLSINYYGGMHSQWLPGASRAVQSNVSAQWNEPYGFVAATFQIEEGLGTGHSGFGVPIR